MLRDTFDPIADRSLEEINKRCKTNITMERRDDVTILYMPTGTRVELDTNHLADALVFTKWCMSTSLAESLKEIFDAK
jgi:hypothetical protein